MSRYLGLAARAVEQHMESKCAELEHTIGSGELWSLGTRGIEGLAQVASHLVIHGNASRSRNIATKRDLAHNYIIKFPLQA